MDNKHNMIFTATYQGLVKEVPIDDGLWRGLVQRLGDYKANRWMEAHIGEVSELGADSIARYVAFMARLVLDERNSCTGCRPDLS